MNNEVRDKLSELIKKFGTSLSEDESKLRAILRDVLNKEEYLKQVNILLLAVREGITKDLNNNSTPIMVLIPQLIKRLIDNHGVEQSNAQWVVETWAYALEINYQKSSYSTESNEKAVKTEVNNNDKFPVEGKKISEEKEEIDKHSSPKIDSKPKPASLNTNEKSNKPLLYTLIIILFIGFSTFLFLKLNKTSVETKFIDKVNKQFEQDHAEKDLTRYEIAQILFEEIKLIENKLSLDLKKDSINYPMNDVSNDYFSTVTGIVSQYKVISGFPDQTFRGNLNMPRYQIATSISKLIKLFEEKSGKSRGIVLITHDIVDLSENHWAYSAVKNTVFKYKVIPTYPDNTFRGNRYTTNKDMIMIINNLRSSLNY